MYTISVARSTGNRSGNPVAVRKAADEVGWLPSQTHIGENIGASETHVIFVERK